jgi:UDP:flavonoid glycosyltransferase YjiC (YdhE family)
MMASALQADTLFFPSFTPREILSQYKSKIIEVPLIVRKQRQQPKIRQGNTKKIMFIDSGSGVNKLAMLEIAKQLPALTNFHFYIGEQLGIQSENITPIPQKELLVDYIAQMDLVVGRAGFNTISECIAYRTPMLLFGESSNPEMRENTVFVKEQGLGSFISIETLIRSTEKVLNDFFEGEYSVVERNMNLHTFRTDGAKVIAEIIAEKMSKK